METVAGDFAEICRERGIPRAARLFEQAAQTLSEKDLINAENN
jgi:hypothetical protein